MFLSSGMFEVLFLAQRREFMFPGIILFLDAGPCFPNPCKNNGNCTQVGDSFKCKCTADHEGESCETGKKTWL